MTARERALKEFHLRWKKDAESDGELLPLQKRLENAWAEGRQSLAEELKEWAKDQQEKWHKTDLVVHVHPSSMLEAVIAECDELMKEKS